MVSGIVSIKQDNQNLSLLQNLKELFFPGKAMKTLDTSFTFPYAADKDVKRQQVWDNLKKGILFEDTGVFLPWLAPFGDLDKHAQHRIDKEDRTEWFFGKHQILDGYSCHLSVMKWIFVKHSEPFTPIEEWLGVDDEGYQRLLFVKDKVNDLLGEPSLLQLNKYGDLELGSIEWTNHNVKIQSSGIEQFVCKYRMSIGLSERRDW